VTELRDRIHHLLWHSWHDDDLLTEQREAYCDEVICILADHPELDAFFLDRYVTRHTDEWELNRGLSILTYVGKRRPHDHAPLLGLLRRDDVSIGYKRRALYCVTQLADHLDERVLLDLLDSIPSDLYRSAVCKTIDALASVRDRAKAARLLGRCLKATDTTDEETFRFLLDNLLNSINGNEDIFEAVLRATSVPHEIVLMAVSLMKETLPTDGRYRRMAEEAARQSQLAEDYFNFYVGRYVAKDK